MNSFRMYLASGLLSVALLTLPVAGILADENDATEAERILTKPLSRIKGPKRSVAVAFFGATTTFSNEYGLSDVGGGLAALLSTALVESGQFVVVERTRLSSVLMEQELAASEMLQAEGAPEVGELLGAQYLVMGEVTEFTENAKRSAFSIGVGNGDRRIALAPGKREGKVAIDVRVVNTSTGEVVEAFHVSEKVKARAFSVTLEQDDVSLGHSQLANTALGQAARAAINAVAQTFAKAAAKEPWRGAVVDYDQLGIAINAGQDAGVRVGDAFLVQRIAKVLTDPTTGRVLGKRAYNVGEIKIFQVEGELAYGEYIPQTNIAPQRGDVVTLL